VRTVGLCIGSYGAPRGWAFSYERGTPVTPQIHPQPPPGGGSRKGPEQGPSVPRRAHQSQGGAISAEAVLRRRVTRARNLSVTRALAAGEFFIDNLLVRIHFIIEMILVDRPCAMGV